MQIGISRGHPFIGVNGIPELAHPIDKAVKAIDSRKEGQVNGITREDLEQHSGMKLEDADNKLGGNLNY